MSIIKSGTTTTTAYSVDANTDGDLVFIVSESLTAMTISASGAVSLPTSSLTITSGATLNGGVVVNEPGADVDFRVEGDTDANLLFVDASTDRVGVGLNTPGYKFDVLGSVQLKTGATATPVIVSTGSDTQGTLRFGASSTEYSINGGADYLAMIFNTNGSECARIPAAGGFQVKTCVSVGDATPAASGAGVTFPPTQSASSDANTLDDYEEGTWTPTVEVGGSSVGITYSAQSGQYVKIGKNVLLNLYIALANKGAGSGAVGISGLPFPVASGIDVFIPMPPRSGINTGGLPVALYLNGLLYKCNLTGGSNSTVNETEIGNTTEFNFNFWYQTSS
jgi:hypothetical protein